MTLNYDKVLFTSVKTRSNFDALYHGKGFQRPLAMRSKERRLEVRDCNRTFSTPELFSFAHDGQREESPCRRQSRDKKQGLWGREW